MLAVGDWRVGPSKVRHLRSGTWCAALVCVPALTLSRQIFTITLLQLHAYNFQFDLEFHTCQTKNFFIVLSYECNDFDAQGQFTCKILGQT